MYVHHVGHRDVQLVVLLLARTLLRKVQTYEGEDTVYPWRSCGIYPSKGNPSGYFASANLSFPCKASCS